MFKCRQLQIKNFFLNKKLWLSITVEPSFMVYIVVRNLSVFFLDNLLLQKACRFNATTEPDLSTKCDDEKHGIELVAMLHAYCMPASVVMVTFSILASSWSDRAGKRRRPVVLLPLAGMIAEMTLACLHSYFWYWSPFSTILSNKLSQALSGGYILHEFACMLYISDVSSRESRTMRIGVLAILRYISGPVSQGLSGFILKRFGFLDSFLLCWCLSVISFVLAWIFVKDISVPVEKKLTLWQSVNPTHMFRTIKHIFLQKSMRNRLLLVFTMLASVTAFFSSLGEKSVLYLYLRYRFHWTEEQFSVFSAYRDCVTVIGSVLCMIILSKYLKWRDEVIAILASICDTLAAVGYFFANNTWQLYLAGLFDLFHYTAYVVGASILSKMVDKSELGSLSAFTGMMHYILPFNKVIYNLTFKHTMDSFPNCFYLINITLAIFTLGLYGTTYKLQNAEKNLKQTEIKN